MYYPVKNSDAMEDGLDKFWLWDFVFEPILEDIVISKQERVDESWLNYEKRLLEKEFEPDFNKFNAEKAKFSFKPDPNEIPVLKKNDTTLKFKSAEEKKEYETQ